jgi:protein-disulfide isomerase
MFEKILTTVLTIAALVIAAGFTHREFFSSPRYGTPSVIPTFQKDWEAALDVGRSTGGSGRVQVVEFADLECPVCSRAYASLFSDTSAVGRKYRSQISFRFVHFPLSMHRFARPAARAAECAGSSGRFFEFVSAVFAKQDSLGLRAWSAYARDAGVADVGAFEKCTRLTTPIPDIEKGVAVGKTFGITGTPTIFINGWQYRGLIPESTYANAIEAALAGRKPANAR